MTVGIPQNIELTQIMGSVMYNLPGTVTVKGSLPSGATYFRVYLSEQKGALGTLAATVSPGGTFNATKGKLFYATVRGYSSSTSEESTNTNQQPLQMVESLFDRHGLCFRSFYHEPNTNVIWATAFKGNTVLAEPTDYVLPFQNVTDIVLVKSSDYFDTYELVHTFNRSFRLDAYLGVWKDSTGCIYVSARPKILISRDNGQTFQELWSNSTDLADQRTPWNFSEVNGTIFISEYANGPAKIYDSSSGTYIDDAMPSIALPTAYTLHVSSDPNRVVWQHIDLYSKTDRHCHNFKVHPKYPNIWLLATGDNNPASNPGGGRGSVAGFWISKDSGTTWTHVWNPVTDGGKLGPTGITFWDDGSVIIGLDIGGAKVQKVDLDTYQCTDLFPDLHTTYPGIDSGFIMDVKAVTGSKETYIQDSAYYINYNYGIVRYEGDTGKYNLVVQTVNTHSAGGENFGCSADGTIPAHAKYVFSDMAYGSRIPREYTTLTVSQPTEEPMYFGAPFGGYFGQETVSTATAIELSSTGTINIPATVNMTINAVISATPIQLSASGTINIPASVSMGIYSAAPATALELSVSGQIDIPASVKMRIIKLMVNLHKTSTYRVKEIPDQYTVDEIPNRYNSKEIPNQYVCKELMKLYQYTLGETKPIQLQWSRKDGKDFTITSAIYTFEEFIEEQMSIDGKTTLTNLTPTSIGTKYCTVEVELTAIDPALPVEVHIEEPQIIVNRKKNKAVSA